MNKTETSIGSVTTKTNLGILNRPNLIVIDMQLLDMDGLQAMTQMRGDYPLIPIPIIVLTAKVSSRDRDRYLAVGIKDFLVKPIKLRYLLSVIQRKLEKIS